MGALGRVLAASAPGAADGYWYEPRAAASIAGVAVTPDSVLTLPALFGGIAAISETVATLPFHMFLRTQRSGQPGKAGAPNHPLEDVIGLRPNAHQSAAEFWEMMIAIAILRGRSVAEILPGPRGAVDQLVPLHPDLVRQETQNGERVWSYRDPKRSFAPRMLHDDEVFIVRGRLGRGLIDVARDNVGVSLAIQRHQGTLFSRGARHQGVIKHPGKLAPGTREAIQREIDKFTVAGQYSGRPMLLEDGMEWQSAGFSDRDTQLAELLRMSVLDAARWLRMPPHKLAELGDATFSNVEEMGIEWVTDTILPWSVRIEQNVNWNLVLPAARARYFAEFNLEGLLRGNAAARAAFYEVMTRIRAMTRNEVRAKENLSPVEGGDDFDVFPTTGATLPATRAWLRGMVRDQAARAVRKESEAVARLGPDEAGVTAFYAAHEEFVARVLRIPDEEARQYARTQASRLLAVGRLPDEADRIDQLTDIALATAGLAAAA